MLDVLAVNSWDLALNVFEVWPGHGVEERGVIRRLLGMGLDAGLARRGRPGLGAV